MSGDLPGARDVLQASLKVKPDQFAARLSLGRVYLRLNDSQAAECNLRRRYFCSLGVPKHKSILPRH